MLGFKSKEEFYVYLTCLGIGMSILFTFNAFISVPSYMMSYYKYTGGAAAEVDSSSSDVNRTSSTVAKVPEYPSFWENIESYIAVTSMGSGLVFQILVLAKSIRKISFQSRLYFSMTFIILSMVMVPLLVVFKPSELVSAAVLLAAVGICGAAGAIFQSTSFALVANFPSKQMASLLFGNGISGTICGLISIITKGAMSDSYDSIQTQSRIYFGISIAWVVVTFIGVIRLPSNPYARHYIAEYRRKAAVQRRRQKLKKKELDGKQAATPHDLVEEDEDEMGRPTQSYHTLLNHHAARPLPPLAAADTDNDGRKVGNLNGDSINSALIVKSDDLIDDDDEDDDDEEQVTDSNIPSTSAFLREALTKVDEEEEEGCDNRFEDNNKDNNKGEVQKRNHDENHDEVHLLHVISVIWPMMLSCFLVFFASMTVYPGVGVAINPTGKWFGVVIVFLFNLGDMVGMFSSHYPHVWIRRSYVPICCGIRLVVIPLFLLCARHIIPYYEGSNVIFPYLLMFVTGCTNGLLGSLTLIYGPMSPELTTDGERAIAGSCVSMSLIVGASSGAMVALALTTYAI